jgi:lysosomal acid phosphatase
MSQVIGVIVLARNGDRLEYYQDPVNYGATFTETTPLGEVSKASSDHPRNGLMKRTLLSIGPVVPAWLLVEVSLS